MFTVTFVRHSETVNNVAKILQGCTDHADGQLTEKGILMAQDLGKFLKKEKFTHIFSSDLKRCRDTTLHLVNQLTSKIIPPIKYLPILRERHLGDWELQPYQMFHEGGLKSNLPPHKYYQIDIPNGEPFEEAKQRIAKFFLENIVKLYLDKDRPDEVVNILVVSHGGCISSLFNYFLETETQFQVLNLTADHLKTSQPNTARSRLVIEDCPMTDESHKIILNFTNIFDVDHLKSVTN